MAVVGDGAGDREPLLHPVEPRGQPVGAVVDPGQQQPGAEQLEEQPRRGRALQVRQTGGDELGVPGEVVAAEPRRLRDQPLGLVLGDVDEAGGGGVGDGGDDDEVAEPLEQVLGEAARVLAGLDDLVDGGEDRAGVLPGEGVDDLVEQACRG